MASITRRALLSSGMASLPACTKRNESDGASPSLRVLGVPSRVAQDLAADVTDEYTRQTGIAVEFIPGWEYSFETLKLAEDVLGDENSSPDILYVDLVYVPALAKHLTDLSGTRGLDWSIYPPAVLDACRLKEQLLAVPMYLNVGVLFYRADLLRQAGFDAAPRSWEEMTEIAGRVQSRERAAGRSDFYGFVWQGGKYEGLTCNALEWFQSEGTQLFDASGNVFLDAAAAEVSLRRAADWVGTISPPSVAHYRELESLNYFLNGNACFLRQWTNASPRLRSHPGVAITPIPARSSKPVLLPGGFQLALPRKSRRPREAAELIARLTSRETQRQRALKRGLAPAVLPLYREAEIQARFPVGPILADAARQDWVVRPAHLTGPRYPAVSEAVQQNVHAVIMRETAPGTGAAKLIPALREAAKG